MMKRKYALAFFLISLSFTTYSQESNEFAIKSIEDFDRTISTSSKPVIAQFHSGCPVCLVTGAMVREVASGYKNDIKFIEVDINKFVDLAQRYTITALPTVIIYDPKKQPALQYQMPDPKKDALEEAIKQVTGKQKSASWQCYWHYIPILVLLAAALMVAVKRKK